MTFVKGKSGNPSSQFNSENQPTPEQRERKGSVSYWLKQYGEASKIEMQLAITNKKGVVTETKAIIEAKSQDGEMTQTINQVLAVTALHKAAKADATFWKEVLNRQEGRTPLAINLGGQQGNPVKVVYKTLAKGRIAQPIQPSNESEFVDNLGPEPTDDTDDLLDQL